MWSCRTLWDLRLRAVVAVLNLWTAAVDVFDFYFYVSIWISQRIRQQLHHPNCDHDFYVCHHRLLAGIYRRTWIWAMIVLNRRRAIADASTVMRAMRLKLRPPMPQRIEWHYVDSFHWYYL